jgi:hypothetical protein
MVTIPLLIFLFPSPANNRGVRQLAWVIVWYIIAKVPEHFDKEIYPAVGVSADIP